MLPVDLIDIRRAYEIHEGADLNNNTMEWVHLQRFWVILNSDAFLEGHGPSLDWLA